jgi:hypothetical protein
LKTPVLFLVFNRPSTTQAVFDRIRQAQPQRLYVAADGPRSHRPDDRENCAAVLGILDQVDWDCQVTKLVRTENLGCGRAVSSAITWFFEQVEEGIILEDDVLPETTFFEYCEGLLERYRDDPSVLSISGSRLPGTPPTPYSYHFSRYVGIWGWASWRRAWSGYDFGVKAWETAEAKAMLRREFGPGEYRFFAGVFDNVLAGKIDTWDYQWWFHVLVRKGLSVTPGVNQTVNLGFDSGGTHTHGVGDEIRNLKSQPLAFPLRHPGAVRADRTQDRVLSRRYYSQRGDGLGTWLKTLVKRWKP